MSWGDEVAAAYRGAGTAESVIFTTNGAPATYADCQVEEKAQDRVLENGSRAVVRYLVIHIPATTGVTAPAENSSLTWNSRQYTTSAPATGHGFFRVEAA